MTRGKAIAVGVLIALLTLWVPAHGQAGKVVYLYNWYGQPDPWEALFLDLIAEFEEAHPHIEVELIRGGTVDGRSQTDRLISLIAAGTPPDVVEIERSQIIEFAAKGVLAPLDHHFGSAEEEFIPAAMREVIYKGSIYGLPWGTDVRGLFWNRADFQAAGYDADRPPATIEELDAMAARLTRVDGDGAFTKLGFIPWLGNWYATSWLYTFGGEVFDYDTMKPRVNTPDHIRGFEWIQEYGQRYPYDVVAATLASKNQYTFYDQTLSMIAHWNGFAQYALEADPSLDIGVGEVPHPPYGTNGTHSGGYAHVITEAANNRDDALTLLEWLASKESEVRLYRATKSLPTRRSAIDEILGELSPTDAILVRQMEVAWGRPPLEYPPFYTKTTEAMLKVARLEASAKEALDEAQRLLEIDYKEILGD